MLLESEYQLVAVVSEPFAGLPVARIIFLDEPPEGAGVVFLGRVGEFVDDDVVYDKDRCHNESPVKLEPVIMRAVPPF